MKKLNNAFTMAELLLVVAILGVVAALTIPNLNNDINEDKYVTLLRTSISQLDAAFGKVLSEYGSLAKAGDSCGTTRGACLGGLLTSYLDLNLNCTTVKNGKCFTTGKLLDIDGVVVVGKSNASTECDYTFILANGVAVCLDEASSASASDGRVHIDVDVDGPTKGPNRRGYDCFRLMIADNYYNSIYDRLRPRTGSSGRIREDGSIDGFHYDEYTEWAFSIGNMDYIRCADELNWVTKHSCD